METVTNPFIFERHVVSMANVLNSLFSGLGKSLFKATFLLFSQTYSAPMNLVSTNILLTNITGQHFSSLFYRERSKEPARIHFAFEVGSIRVDNEGHHQYIGTSSVSSTPHFSRSWQDVSRILFGWSNCPDFRVQFFYRHTYIPGGVSLYHCCYSVNAVHHQEKTASLV